MAVVVAKGINVEQGNIEVPSQGTGFFINRDGLVVTSYHLRKQLGPSSAVPDESVSYRIHLGLDRLPIPAVPVYTSEALDIMVLYAPVESPDIEPLTPADRSSANLEIGRTTVYTAGFAGGFSYSITPGTITSFTGAANPPTPGWTTNVNYAPGQSGSPVVLDDGRVVAIAKSSDSRGASLGILVPTAYIPREYWEPGVGTRLAAVQNAPSVVVTANLLTDRPREVVRPVTLSKSACDAPSPQSLRFAPEPGWSIDPASVNVSTAIFRGKQLQTRAANASPSGFDLLVEMAPAGLCLFGRPSGDGALYSGTVRYLEKPGSPVDQSVVIAEVKALPGIQVPLASGLGSSINVFLKDEGGELTPVRTRSRDITGLPGELMLDVGRIVRRAEDR